MIALFLMLNYLGLRHYKRFDWTRDQLYTLSDKSKTVIDGLDQDVDIIMLLNPSSELYRATAEIVDRVAAANPQRIRRRDMDAAKDLLAVRQLIDQHNIDRDNVVVVAGRDDKRIIGEYELAEYDYSGAQSGQPPTIAKFKGEQLIVSALLSLQENEKPQILFTSGHGEAPLAPGSARSLSQAREILGGDNFDIREWGSTESGEIPSDTDLLVIAGPTTNFLPPERDVLDRYLKQGGRIMVFADPGFGPGSETLKTLGLEDWLGHYGIRLQADLVVDPSSELPFYGSETLFTDRYGRHPIVETLRQTRTRVLMPLTRSVSAMVDNPAGAEVTELITTTEEGWGEVHLDRLGELNRDADDLQGPVSVAVAATLPVSTESSEFEKEEARLVVFGDLDWATDSQVANGSNGLLLLNTFNWLVEREELIDIEGKAPEQSRLTLFDSELFTLYAIFVLLLPAFAGTIGLWIAVRRRR